MVLELNEITTVLLAFLVYLFGDFLTKKVKILYRFAIPAPVVGGLLVAILILILSNTNIVTIKLDTSFQSLFMIAFFTTIGLGASFALVKLGGKLLVIYWLAAGVIAILQNVVGVSVAKLFNLDPLFGVVLGTAAMEGGHGGVTAYGTTLEEMGVDGALSIGLAAATFGLIAGGLIGGPIVQHLIRKYDLKPSIDDEKVNLDDYNEDFEGDGAVTATTSQFIHTSTVIVFCMAVGTYLGDMFTEATGFSLPGYVGAMFVAVLVRNIIDRSKPEVLNLKVNSLIGEVTLAIFLSMALMSINLGEISGNVLPIIVALILQVALMAIFASTILFRLLGKDYDSAIMVAGFIGHGLGATPNAMANMHSVTQQHGMSHKAFLIVPIVGAFLIEVLTVPIILATINLFS